MPSIPAPLKIRDYRAFWVARFFATVAGMMMVVVIGWQVYDIARESMSRDDAAFLLGMIGLAQFLPLFCLALVVGVIADRVDRRYIARAAVAPADRSWSCTACGAHHETWRSVCESCGAFGTLQWRAPGTYGQILPPDLQGTTALPSTTGA